MGYLRSSHLEVEVILIETFSTEIVFYPLEKHQKVINYLSNFLFKTMLNF